MLTPLRLDHASALALAGIRRIGGRPPGRSKRRRSGGLAVDPDQGGHTVTPAGKEARAKFQFEAQIPTTGTRDRRTDQGLAAD